MLQPVQGVKWKNICNVLNDLKVLLLSPNTAVPFFQACFENCTVVASDSWILNRYTDLILRERREGSSVCVMRPCCRPTEAARFCERKFANNRQLIAAGVQRFFNTHAQLTSVSYIHAKRSVRYVYIRKH